MVTEQECREALYELSLLVAQSVPDDVCSGCSCLSCIEQDGKLPCDKGYGIKVLNDLINEHFEKERK